MTAERLARALIRWQHAAGPFWPYVCAAPFLGTGESLQLAAGIPARPARTVPRSQGDDCRGDTFQVVLADVPAEPLLAAAPELTDAGWYVVPVIQRWIASPAVLPCRRLLELLLRGADGVRRPAQPRGAILVADGDRTGPPAYPVLVPGRTFDNRYEYQICRLPSTRFLLEHGVQEVRWLTSERPPVPGPNGPEPMTLGLPPVARDLQPYREMLLQAGIEVAASVATADTALGALLR
ncbi:MAG: hypothetical protein IT306_19600 [Chloroflexi bacterium]|nr:hypothetical protein [Chloroflexota bacterium]